ncbi:AfsR/SARP family transcriptional regulator [Catenuloplanes japonicus]|uniref:AfsR/SARP family transcriptional regulator n=1 Tax=Catenuloplanes japonicus TaxID=33876 RepID=UPI0018DC1D4C|nr:BTAD domain-containing putative transcriptional regulator [Catenuloplanes japonicus]
MGNIEIVTDDGTSISPSRGAVRCVLGAFALSPGRRLGIDDLVSRVWGIAPPDRADETVTTYVRSVRRALTQAGVPADTLRSHRPRMYSLDLSPKNIDYHIFRSLCAAASEAAARNDPRSAVSSYEAALGKWRGDALSGVESSWAESRRHALEIEWAEVVYALCDQLSDLGDQHAVATWTERIATESVPTDRMILVGIRALC